MYKESSDEVLATWLYEGGLTGCKSMGFKNEDIDAVKSILMSLETTGSREYIASDGWWFWRGSKPAAGWLNFFS